MASSGLTWVYTRQERAKEVPKHIIDQYKEIIRELYLDKNRTRAEVINHLKDKGGLTLTVDQLSKATKRWGFLKQPRQSQAIAQAPEAPDFKSPVPVLSPPKALVPSTSRGPPPCDFGQRQKPLPIHHMAPDLCSDYLACCYLFQDSFNFVNGNIHFSIPQFLNLMRIAKSPSMGESTISLLQDFHPLEAAERDADKTTVLPYTSAEDRMLFHAYLFDIYSLIPGRENQAQRHLGRLREIRDELLAGPYRSLSMWSVLLLQQDTNWKGTQDNLLERLEIDDGEFLYSFQMCLHLCKQFLELAEKGLSSHFIVQFDSIFLCANDPAISQEISRLMRKESPLDTWKEAGFLFAFIWGNAQQETSTSLSWWNQVEISGISPTHFLAIVCRMIIHQATNTDPHMVQELASRYVSDQCISSFYVQAIVDMLETGLPTRHLKREFLQHFTQHHTWSELEPEDDGPIERVQNYQQSVLDNVIRHSMDSDKHHSSMLETSPQAAPSQTDARITHPFNNSPSRSISSSHGSQAYLRSLSKNPTMTESLASGSSQGSSTNSFQGFKAASKAIAVRLKDYQGSHIQSLDEQGSRV